MTYSGPVLGDDSPNSISARTVLTGASCHEGRLHWQTRKRIAATFWRVTRSHHGEPDAWVAVIDPAGHGKVQRTFRLSRDCAGSVHVESAKPQGYGWQLVCRMS